jgi:opacity protein-like surface antigen
LHHQLVSPLIAFMQGLGSPQQNGPALPTTRQGAVMLKSSTLAALCLLAGSVSAADLSFYLGAGKTGSEFRVDDAIDDDDSGFKLIAGVAIQDRLDLELSYADHGRTTLPSGIACIDLVGVDCPSTSYLSAKTTSLFAVGYMGDGVFRFLGKAGFSHSDSRLRTPEFDAFGTRDEKLNFAWGFGAQMSIRNLAVRAEYERWRIIQGHRLKAVSVNFLYTFF